MEYENRVRRSSLWAAYGDALGFITELAGSSMLKRRTGATRVDALRSWTRRVGGQYGETLELPSGCYSDDTQLRIATCRAIRGNGDFDVDAFAAIELPVWNAYSLGGGCATKTGAEELSRPGARWFSNFYNTTRAEYLMSGGNGAAMRIQPHIWCASEHGEMVSALRDVIRNTVVTHGHPRAIVGAAFHGACVYSAVHNERIPGACEWREFLGIMNSVSELIRQDADLSAFWLPTWELKYGQSIESAIKGATDELASDIDLLVGSPGAKAQYTSLQDYSHLVESLGCLKREGLGSGTKTSLLASFIAWKSEGNPIEGMKVAANVLGSDTDTIASMAGAIAGSIASDDPPQMIMDQPYLERESARLARIAAGKITEAFRYPDLLYWRAPKRQLDVVGTRDDRWFVAGLGEARPVGEPQSHADREVVWRWFELSFGQRVLLKHRQRPGIMANESLPLFSRNDDLPKPSRGSLRVTVTKESSGRQSDARNGGSRNSPASVDQAADDVIRSGFDAKIIGSWLLRFSDEHEGVDKAIAFAAIVSKARNARQRKAGAAK